MGELLLKHLEVQLLLLLHDVELLVDVDVVEAVEGLLLVLLVERTLLSHVVEALVEVEVGVRQEVVVAIVAGVVEVCCSVGVFYMLRLSSSVVEVVH